ncbi:hypothetical protein ACFW4X_23870 [Streptomyces smyrnaeus]|uniref:WXG100 family type VII secretion target n=1 Tax=Streptomyces smyrnaeus TaxID=1387713 RepID=A0ABS3XPT7_9ACTN|nr:hypothetical protein [Streptomyces smyrnaeus]MBO8197349.1 hypothetical protein [Streptomyces smyrnaeus]
MGDENHHDVKLACERIQRLSDDHWHVLDASCRAMDDDAWVGPVGRLFKDELNTLRSALRSQLAEAVKEADAKLQSVPRKP